MTWRCSLISPSLIFLTLIFHFPFLLPSHFSTSPFPLFFFNSFHFSFPSYFPLIFLLLLPSIPHLHFFLLSPVLIHPLSIYSISHHHVSPFLSRFSTREHYTLHFSSTSYSLSQPLFPPLLHPSAVLSSPLIHAPSLLSSPL